VHAFTATQFYVNKASAMTEDIEAFHNEILSQRYILRMFRLNLDLYKASYECFLFHIDIQFNLYKALTGSRIPVIQ